MYALRVQPGLKPSSGKGIESGDGVGRYFRGALELWTVGLMEGLTGFVLTWTLFYGLVRA